MNAKQQITEGQFRNNLIVINGYDVYGFPTLINASTTTDTIQDYSYNFNPVTGNLNWRRNNKFESLREDFQYDDLDRLTEVYMDTTMILNLEYDSNKGGITTKSDVGVLHYDIASNPYAVSSINPSTGLIQSPDSITWTSFEKACIISENGDSAYFVYDSDNERACMTIRHNDTTVLVRWYPSNSYIKEISEDITKEYTFIGGDAYTASVVAITQNSTTTYYNLIRDHLGNITQVVNSENNNLVAEYSYDAWGRMRNPSTWENFPPDSVPELIVAGRGFTGHEHLPWFSLINMNGRLYDPLIGQFLNPDNYIQNPSNSQSYNRFAYCLNNPLSYADPSGDNWIFVGLAWLVGNFGISMLDNMINNDMNVNDALKNANYTTTYTKSFNTPKSSKPTDVEEKYDPGVTVKDPITGRESWANSGSEVFDNWIASNGLNYSDIAIEPPIDIYIPGYLTNFSPDNFGNGFCSLKTCEYLSILYGIPKDINYFMTWAVHNNINPAMVGKGRSDYKNLINGNFKTGKTLDNGKNIFLNLNKGLPIASQFWTGYVVDGNLIFHSVTLIGYNTKSYEIIFMDPWKGISRLPYTKFIWQSFPVTGVKYPN